MKQIELCAERSIRRIEGGIGHDHPRRVAQPFQQAPEEIAAEPVVLPKHADLFLGIIGLDVIRIDAAFGTKCGWPSHRPGKVLWIGPLIVARCDKQLWYALFVEIFSNREIARGSKRAEHEERVFGLDEVAREPHS